MATFVCPMHPKIREKKPGLCPICGMRLVSESEAEKHASTDTHNSSFFSKYKPLLVIVGLNSCLGFAGYVIF